MSETKEVVPVTWEQGCALGTLWDEMMNVRYNLDMPQVFCDMMEKAMTEMPLWKAGSVPLPGQE